MNDAVQPDDVSRFRALVSRRMGLRFEDARLDHLADVLREQLEAGRHARAAVYLDRLAAGSRDELRALARRLTVGETYFFRYFDQFRAFTGVVIPERLHAPAGAKGRRRLRVLSAGCSSGEEAYSLAILTREQLTDPSAWDVQVCGIDINPAMIEKAQRAIYTEWSLRETSPAMRERYFRPEGRQFELDPRVRPGVSFEERNLLEDDPGFWQGGAFDVVFCRNVTMYFTPEVMRAVIARFAHALAPGGFLFLGHAETLRGISSEFDLCHTNNTFYYRLRDPSHPPASERFEAADPSPTLGPEDLSWVDAIRRASERVARLTRSSRPRELAAPESGEGASRERGERIEPADLRPAVELLRQERFADAVRALHALPAATRAEPEAQLLRAVLFTHGGQLAEAEHICRDILAVDGRNAGAHYLSAVCRENAGDGSAAIEHDRVASTLDAAFAMPHLHLGLLARKAGNLVRARPAFERALALLVRETPSRILLFGGGFSREALIDLCRAELRICDRGEP